MIVASTPSDWQSAWNSSHCSGATASTIRSWASEIQISVYDKPVVLERRSVEPDFGADLFPISPTARGKPAGAAIGDRVKQSAVAGLEDHVEHHLFGDRVADLHGAAGDAFALAGQLGRAERRAVNAVAPGAPADRHDPIARRAAL